VSAVDEDWRVEVGLDTEGLAGRMLEGLRERRVAREARARLGDGVSISVDAHRLFAYAADEPGARRAAAVLAELAAGEDLNARVEVTRWHPMEGRWEDPEMALPTTAAERQAEHGRLDAAEREDSERRGHPEWEVEIDLPSQEATAELAARLQAEGLRIGRRRSCIVLGADTEDDAARLAERMRGEAPGATRIVVQGSEADAWTRLHPFPFLGGLGN
jgi:hypothetical protein